VHHLHGRHLVEQLGAVHSTFTEGFDTADLVEARDLLS
jgi:hypothetical protein